MQQVPLLFWTARGARLWQCHVFSSPRARQSARTYLVVPSAAAWSTLDTLQRDPIACLAHELRTPLAAIQAYADLLLETRLSDGKDEGARDYVQSIRHAAHHGLDVVASLLQRNDPDAAARNGQLQPVALDPLIRAAVATLRPLAARVGARLDIVASPPAPLVMSDSTAVAQIVINLLANALRHAGAAPHIEIRFGRDTARRVWLEIADDGPGFPGSILQRFAARSDPFAPPPPRGSERKSRGSGIGLALSRALAANSGARLVLASGKLGGATARLIFATVARQSKARRKV